MKTVYDYTVKDRKGHDVSLKEYAGEVMLIVNTATRCGFTPQYAELEQLYEQFRSRGFNILDFPCNQFGQQAPGTADEIKEFCRTHMAKHKTPRYVRFVNSFPMNAAGKILKYKMRDEAVEYLKLQDAASIVTA